MCPFLYGLGGSCFLQVHSPCRVPSGSDEKVEQVGHQREELEQPWGRSPTPGLSSPRPCWVPEESGVVLALMESVVVRLTRIHTSEGAEGRVVWEQRVFSETSCDSLAEPLRVTGGVAGIEVGLGKPLGLPISHFFWGCPWGPGRGAGTGASRMV